MRVRGGPRTRATRVEALDVEELLGEGVAELDIDALADLSVEEELVQETET